jgi:hypothetical protein
MLTRFALASVVFGLLVACSGAPDAGERDPGEGTTQVGQAPEGSEGSTGKVSSAMRRSGATRCECTLEAGDNVWRCNGQCSDEDLENLPH